MENQEVRAEIARLSEDVQKYRSIVAALEEKGVQIQFTVEGEWAEELVTLLHVLPGVQSILGNFSKMMKDQLIVLGEDKIENMVKEANRLKDRLK